MRRVYDAEQLVAKLTLGELGDFRRWFTAFDLDAWDRQFEADGAAGQFDTLAAQALAAHVAGRATKL